MQPMNADTLITAAQVLASVLMLAFLAWHRPSTERRSGAED